MERNTLAKKGTFDCEIAVSKYIYMGWQLCSISWTLTSRDPVWLRQGPAVDGRLSRNACKMEPCVRNEWTKWGKQDAGLQVGVWDCCGFATVYRSWGNSDAIPRFCPLCRCSKSTVARHCFYFLLLSLVIFFIGFRSRFSQCVDYMRFNEK